MKKIYFFLLFASALCKAQINWQGYSGAPTNGFWDMDTLNGKLYVSYGLIHEFDGTNWTVLGGYNQSLNTPHKDKSCVKTLNGKLYAGAADFNTIGAGDIHYYSGGIWTELQNTIFHYTANHKIRSFAKLNSDIYVAGDFEVPGSSVFKNIAKWNGTDWVHVGRNFGNPISLTEIKDLETYQNKLYLTQGSNIWAYNGTSWDSILYTSAMTFPLCAGVNDMTVYNNKIYFSGNFVLNSSATNYDFLVNYDGSSFNSISSSLAATYTTIGNMGVVGNKLFFFAKKTADNNVYIAYYDGVTVTEVGKVADYGDFTASPGAEIYTFKKIIGYNNDLLIGGIFAKVNGQNISNLAHINLSTVGIKENEQAINLTFYPNPMKNSATLKISGIEPKNMLLKINDLTGRLISAKTITANETQISREGIESGLYLYSLYSNGECLKSGKIVME